MFANVGVANVMQSQKKKIVTVGLIRAQSSKVQETCLICKDYFYLIFFPSRRDCF